MQFLKRQFYTGVISTLSEIYTKNFVRIYQIRQCGATPRPETVHSSVSERIFIIFINLLVIFKNRFSRKTYWYFKILWLLHVSTSFPICSHDIMNFFCFFKGRGYWKNCTVKTSVSFVERLYYFFLSYMLNLTWFQNLGIDLVLL